MQISDEKWHEIETEIKGLGPKVGDQIRELKTKVDANAARVLDLEQRNGRTSGGMSSSLLGAGLGGADAIMSALEGSEQWKALLSGESTKLRANFDAGVLRHKTAITATTLGDSLAPYDRSGAILAPAEQRLFVRDLIPSVPTEAAATQFVRESSYTNSAGAQGGASPIGLGQGELKAESSMTFELVTSPVVVIAHGFTLSRQALDDVPALRQHIASRGVYGLKLKEESDLLTGNGGGNVLSGLITNATAFTGGGTNQSIADTLRKAVTQLAVNNHLATGVVLNPVDAESLELAKDAQNRYLNTVILVNGRSQIWRVPIVESNSMGVGFFLMADFAGAARIRDRQSATVEVSLDHSDYRARNLVYVLIEERLGLEIPRPIGLCYGSVSYAG